MSTATAVKEYDSIREVAGEFADINAKYQAVGFDSILIEFAAYLQDLHKEYFAREMSPAQEKWKELSERTKRNKGHDRILWETGRLEASLVSVTSDSIREIVAEGFETWLLYGTGVDYALFHQEPSANSHLPRRSHVGIDALHVNGLVRDVANHTITELRR